MTRGQERRRAGKGIPSRIHSADHCALHGAPRVHQLVTRRSPRPARSATSSARHRAPEKTSNARRRTDGPGGGTCTQRQDPQASRPTSRSKDKKNLHTSFHLYAGQRKSRRRPTLPLGHPSSTIGSKELNFRVRYGIGCSLLDITTGNLWVRPCERCSLAADPDPSRYSRRAAYRGTPARRKSRHGAASCAIERYSETLRGCAFSQNLPQSQLCRVARHPNSGREISMFALEVWSSRTTY